MTTWSARQTPLRSREASDTGSISRSCQKRLVKPTYKVVNITSTESLYLSYHTYKRREYTVTEDVYRMRYTTYEEKSTNMGATLPTTPR